MKKIKQKQNKNNKENNCLKYDLRVLATLTEFVPTCYNGFVR